MNEKLVLEFEHGYVYARDQVMGKSTHFVTK